MSRQFTYYGSFASAAYFTDLFGVPLGAYSLRKLSPNTTYSGAAIRVRRSSDNTEQDINFVSSAPDASIDTSALLSFVGAGNGFVTTWYNQNGSGNHFTQTTAASQPSIVNSGTLIQLNSKPSIFLSEPQFWQQDIFKEKLLDIYLVRETSRTLYIHFTGIDNAGFGYSYVAQSGSSSISLFERYGTPTLYANKTLFTGTTRGNVYTFLNGTKIETHENANTNLVGFKWTFFRFGRYPVSGAGFQGHASELIIFDISKSSQRNDIVDNQNTIYNVF